MASAADKKQLWQSPIVIAVIAFGLRLVAIGFFYDTTWNSIQSHLYFGFETGRIARSIAEGHGYGSPMLIETGPTAWLTPVYPYLVAGVFKLFGIYTKTSAFVSLGVNCLFSALTCIPLFFIAERSFGRGVAIASCWTWALFPYFIYIASSFVWDTCLAALVLTFLFYWALKLREQHGTWRWAGFGALWGFSALTNASTISICPALSVWALYPLWPDRQRWLKAALLVAFGVGIILLPWEVRNYRTLHSPVPLRDNFWLEFWVGNDGHTQRWLDLDAHPSTNAEEQGKFVQLGEIPYMREKRHQALGFLAHHPGLYVVLCLRRFVYLWTGFWNLDPSNVQEEFQGSSNVYLTSSLTLAMLLGFWRARRTARGRVLPYLLVLSFYPLVFYVTHPTIRYRHVIDPEVTILAALGVKSLIGNLRAYPQITEESG
ncbi:MAG TPA: glycosyltransferase family 39 protein [Candidatus Acidoferrales bacterium]|jgi:4-amino-4-deoxy-L-arabinose transferase-like glycosyltransferase|nr:glycosyltransferase family 39 protein [Candidatus Acidoferrales bacterium]